MKYCTNCGTLLEKRLFEERERAFCPQCQQIQFRQLKVGAGGLIERGDRLLLLQRNHVPFQGCWNIPAGYAEHDEDPSQTVIREVREECGLHVQVERLVNVYFFADDPRGNGILIVYKCHPIDGELKSTKEGLHPTFFTREEIPENLAGGGHDRAILAWKSATNRNLKSR
jgi:ADP-ribose pyrophosphatase YjhB (NUDIX family)